MQAHSWIAQSHLKFTKDAAINTDIPATSLRMGLARIDMDENNRSLPVSA